MQIRYIFVQHGTVLFHNRYVYSATIEPLGLSDLRFLMYDHQFPEVRRACLRRLYDPSHGDVLDEALVLWFPAPRSFTGEVRSPANVYEPLSTGCHLRVMVSAA